MRDDAGFLRLGDVGGDGFRVDRGRIDIEAVARFKDLSNDQADGERQRRDGFKIDKRLQTDATDALQIAHRGDAVHHRAEYHRCDHHFDQRNKAVAEWLQGLAEVRIEVPDQDSERDGDQNLNVEDRIPPLTRGDGTDGLCGHWALGTANAKDNYAMMR